MIMDQKTAKFATQINWPLDRIKDLTEKIGSGVTPAGGAASYQDDGIPFLRSQNIHFGGLRLDDVAFISDEIHQEMAGSRLRENDVLLNITGASIGRCTFLPDGFGEGNVNQHVCIIRPTSKLDYRFLNYCLSAPWGQDQILSSFTGASRQGLGQRDLGEIQIPLPPQLDQRRIVAYLDKNCVAIDAAIEAKKKQLETLDVLRKSIIHKAVTRGLDDSVELKDSGVDYLGWIPKHWVVDRLKDVVNLRNIKTDENSEAEDYLELEDIEQGTGKIISKRNTLEVESAVTLFKKGDVLFGKLRPYLEKYYFAEFDGKCTGEILAFEPIKTQGRFLLYCFASPWFIGQCNMSAYGAKMPRVNWPTQLAKINMPLPPKEEQHYIADYLDVKCTEIDSLRKNITDQISTLEQYRKSLIHECVTGKRRIGADDI